MANTCGQCLLFQGPSQKCGAGRSVNANSSTSSSCFKGPASLFSSKVCGSCRLFQGPSQKCGGGRQFAANTPVISSCYSPNPG
jgi:hypothetical protein